MAKKKIKTLKEQREERIRSFKEYSERRIERFRDRLIKVNSPGKVWTILDRQKFFVCGYCSYRMSLYSTRSLIGPEQNPMLFYGCGRRCEPSNIHRVKFLDKKLLQFIFRRLKEKFPEAKGKSDKIDDLLDDFIRLERLEGERQKLMELLPHAGYNRDDIVHALIDIEKEIENVRRANAGLDSDNPAASPLLSPVFAQDDYSGLFDLNLLYLRELTNALVTRIRFFNETLIMKVVPLDDEERRIEEDGGGKIQNIHLSYEIKVFDPSIAKEAEVVEDDFTGLERPPWERIDPEFIMNSQEDSTQEYEKSNPIDLQLVKTEPGSEEEKNLQKGRDKGPVKKTL